MLTSLVNLYGVKAVSDQSELNRVLPNTCAIWWLTNTLLMFDIFSDILISVLLTFMNAERGKDMIMKFKNLFKILKQLPEY